LKFRPKVEKEACGWRFRPFKMHGKVVTAELEEYIDVVPPERMPEHHVTAPVIRPDSEVSIALERTGCYGICSAYTVTVPTDVNRA
jgi:hypothetical protein